MTKTLSLVVTLLALMALTSLASAQATTVCQSTFTAGAGLFDFKFCVTGNGNISQYATPSAIEHIGTGSEGYGICDVASGVEYADYAGGGATFNWLNSVVTQPNGPNTFPLTVFRTTSDGLWQIRQTFTRDVPSRAVKIQMELINQTAVSKSAYLVRFADVDVEGGKSNLFQSTAFSAFGSNFLGVGIQLRDSAKAHPLSLVQNVPAGVHPCNYTGSMSTGAFTGNGSLAIAYILTVPKNGKKTVTAVYRPI
ncbi:MAG: hypothetical protein HY010_08810 [Acidobacteria bacterium]|nr:hypothetical protein [Acidobacteriota bacterium]